MAGTTVGKLNAILTADTSQFTASLTSAEKSISGLASSLGVGLGIGAVVGFLVDVMHEAEEAAKAQAKLEVALSATGNVAGVTADEIGNLATALQNKVAIDDDVIKSSAAVLISFQDIRGEILKKAIPAVADLARFMGKDMDQAALMLGKALADPEEGMGALGKAGIKLDEGQKKLIASFLEMGDVASAQGVILDEVATHTEGAAERMATASDRIKTKWGNLKEELGKPVLGTTETLLEKPSLLPLAGYIATFELLKEPAKELWRIITGGAEEAADAVNELGDALQDESAFFPPLLAVHKDYLDKVNAGLQKQIDTFGMSSDAIKLWEAQQKQIPGYALEATEALIREKDALEESAKAMHEQEQTAAASQHAMDSIKDAIWEQYETMRMSTEQIQLWKLAMEGADEAELEFYGNLLDNIREYKEFAEAEKKREAEAESIHKSTRTQAERAQEEVDRLTELFWAGLVPLEDYQRKLEQIGESLSGAAEAKDDLFATPAAMEFGTAAAFSATRPISQQGDTKTHQKLDEANEVLGRIRDRLAELQPTFVGAI